MLSRGFYFAGSSTAHTPPNICAFANVFPVVDQYRKIFVTISQLLSSIQVTLLSKLIFLNTVYLFPFCCWSSKTICSCWFYGSHNNLVSFWGFFLSGLIAYSITTFLLLNVRTREKWIWQGIFHFLLLVKFISRIAYCHKFYLRSVFEESLIEQLFFGHGPK